MDWNNGVADKTRLLTKHYNAGRSGASIQYIVVHHNAGVNLTVDDCWNIWQNRQASAHYQVQSDGLIGQLVNDWDTAWHAGDWNANCRSIGIEHANNCAGPWTISDKALESGAHLVAALCKLYGLGRPTWLGNVFPHKYFQATQCPGEIAGSQNAQYMARAQAWYDAMVNGSDPADDNPQDAGNPVNDAGLSYRAHVADYGWLDAVRDGQTAGTVGKGIQLEALKIAPPEGLELTVKVHVEDKGWLTYEGVKKGESSGEGSSANDPIMGTVGEGRRLEAIEIIPTKNTTGKTLMYRVHLEEYGWTGWMEADGATGTTGISHAIQAVQMKLI